MLEMGLLSLLPATVTTLFFMYLFFKALDFITGLLKTFKNPDDRYKSSKMRDGLVKWIAEIVGIVFVIVIDMVLGINFILCGATLALFIYKESGSILENLLACGVELPLAVAEKLEVFNKMKSQKGE